MKTLIQKIHVEEHHPFACRTYRIPAKRTFFAGEDTYYLANA